MSDDRVGMRGLGDYIRQYINDHSPEERAEVLRNEQRQRFRSHEAPPSSTYRDQARVELTLEGGRFAAEANLAGSDAALHYPKQPAESPWSTQNPLEAPLGYAINDLPAVGTLAEQAEAAEVLAKRVSASASAPERTIPESAPHQGMESPKGGSLSLTPEGIASSASGVEPFNNQTLQEIRLMSEHRSQARRARPDVRSNDFDYTQSLPEALAIHRWLRANLKRLTIDELHWVVFDQMMGVFNANRRLPEPVREGKMDEWLAEMDRLAELDQRVKAKGWLDYQKRAKRA